MNSQYIEIKKLVKFVNTGLDAIKRAPIVNQNTGIKCLRIQDISQNKPYNQWGNTRVAEKDFEKFQLSKDDILIARTGASIGVLTILNKDYKAVYNNGLIRIKIDFTKANAKYLFYNLKSQRYISHIYGISAGTSTQPNMRINDLLRFKIRYVNIEEQDRIANFLSSLDEKIEINSKINDNLEELTQLLYKHWFVDFEFPDENGNPYKSSGGIMVESELGLIPFGWKVEKLGKSSISNLVKSGIKEFIDKKIYLATADVTNTTITNHNTYINMGNKPSRANMQPKQNTVWFAKMKASRKLIRVSDESQSLIDNYIFSTGFAGIECTKSLNYVWSFVSSNEFDELKNSLATGTTQEAINNGVINNMNFLVPSKNILTKFENVVREFYNKKELNDRENLKLAEMRDLLLPKLMSGEIRLPIEE